MCIFFLPLNLLNTLQIPEYRTETDCRMISNVCREKNDTISFITKSTDQVRKEQPITVIPLENRPHACQVVWICTDLVTFPYQSDQYNPHSAAWRE